MRAILKKERKTRQCRIFQADITFTPSIPPLFAYPWIAASSGIYPGRITLQVRPDFRGTLPQSRFTQPQNFNLESSIFSRSRNIQEMGKGKDTKKNKPAAADAKPAAPAADEKAPAEAKSGKKK
jgi:hypothetical protein